MSLLATISHFCVIVLWPPWPQSLLCGNSWLLPKPFQIFWHLLSDTFPPGSRGGTFSRPWSPRSCRDSFVSFPFNQRSRKTISLVNSVLISRFRSSHRLALLGRDACWVSESMFAARKLCRVRVSGPFVPDRPTGLTPRSPSSFQAGNNI